MSVAGEPRILALSGGVGGARMASGLARVLPPGTLTVAVNVADDFTHLGLAISPDLDTVLYTLAGVVNPATGWGREGESWGFMETLAGLGGEVWFRLGDKDLAVHVERTRRLRAGESLTSITGDLCRRLGVMSEVLPVSDNPVMTMVDTDEGRLAFQDYFVRRQCEPRVCGFSFEGIAAARLQPRIAAVLDDPGLEAVIIGPSNPFVSVEPILAMPGMRDALLRCRAPVVAVSPIVGGQALKGPAAKMMSELGIEPSSLAVAEHYGALLDGLVIDTVDRGLQDRIMGPKVLVAQTVMHGEPERVLLAQEVLAFARGLTR